jgi:hypothetical protein
MSSSRTLSPPKQTRSSQSCCPHNDRLDGFFPFFFLKKNNLEEKNIDIRHQPSGISWMSMGMDGAADSIG